MYILLLQYYILYQTLLFQIVQRWVTDQWIPHLIELGQFQLIIDLHWLIFIV